MLAFPFTKIRVVALAVAFVLLPLTARAGNATPIVAGQETYRLPLDSGKYGLRISETETSMAANVDMVSGSPPILGISIFEPSGRGPGVLKWQYLFSPLSVNDEFVVQGRLYRVTGIVASAARSTWACDYQVSCTPYADVVRLPRVVSAAGRNALVVPGRGPYPNEPEVGSSVTLYTTLDQCTLDLYLDGLSQGSHGYVAHMRSKLDAFEYKRDASKCHEKVDTVSVDARVGDLVSFGDFGRFKVESIWPADAHHKDWVVLVPAKG